MDELNDRRRAYEDEVDVGVGALSEASNAALSAPLLDTEWSFIPVSELKLSKERLDKRVQRLLKEFSASLKSLGRIVDSMGLLEFTFTRKLKYRTKDEMIAIMKEVVALYRADLDCKHALAKALNRRAEAKTLERDDFLLAIDCWGACPFVDDARIREVEKIVKMEFT